MTSLGITLLVLGAVFGAAEAHFPTHGAVGGAGVLLMAVGAALAVSGAGAGVLLGLLIGALLAGAGAAALLVSLKHGLAVQRRRVRTGAEGLVGHLGEVRSWAGATGCVTLDGALWQARRSAAPDYEEHHELRAGDTVVVERLSGLTLSVRPAEEWELF